MAILSLVIVSLCFCAVNLQVHKLAVCDNYDISDIEKGMFSLLMPEG